jgi:hypothetical protein
MSREVRPEGGEMRELVQIQRGCTAFRTAMWGVFRDCRWFLGVFGSCNAH